MSRLAALDRRLWTTRALLAAGVALCWWIGRAPACSGCNETAVWLRLGDGTAIHAELFVPQPAGNNRAAVVVCHGYLANAGFMEVPWAEDLTRLGLVALFIDRRGHGASGGAWWPRAADDHQTLSQRDPEIHAALAYLRAQTPLVDPARVALLGHSDGGTGVIVAASADWEVAATVSLSASVAPWEYVNHVAPRDLLLIYGAEDRFILADTDRALIANATRGYLQGEGTIGSGTDGSARRLMRIADRGHVDVLYSPEARRAALAWLADALALAPPASLAPLRTGWAATGILLLLLLVLTWNGAPRGLRGRGPVAGRILKLTAVTAFWAGGLALAAWIGPRLTRIPLQEGNIVAAVSGAETLLMGTLAFAAHRGRSSLRGPLATAIATGARGAAVGALVQLTFESLLRPLYTITFDLDRLMAFALCLVPAAAAFAATCAATAWVGEGDGLVARGVAVEVVLAALTALVAPLWFVRMSMLPVSLLAFALLFAAAYRAGGGSWMGAAGLGAVMFAHSISQVCAFY